VRTNYTYGNPHSILCEGVSHTDPEHNTMSTTNDSSSDDSTDTTTDEPEYWRVRDSGMTLEKTSFSNYTLSSGSFSITFDDIRDTDEEEVYELRDGYDTLGTFKPYAEDVPESVTVAFRILQHEI
jgi:hypothetical protein